MFLLNSQIASQISANFKSWNIIGCKTSIFHSFTMFNKHHKHCNALSETPYYWACKWKVSNETRLKILKLSSGGSPKLPVGPKVRKFSVFLRLPWFLAAFDGSPDSWHLCIGAKHCASVTPSRHSGWLNSHICKNEWATCFQLFSSSSSPKILIKNMNFYSEEYF